MTRPLDKHENAGIAAGSTAGQAHMVALGKYDLAQYTEAEWLALLGVIFVATTDKIAACYEAEGDPATGTTASRLGPVDFAADLDDDVPF